MASSAVAPLAGRTSARFGAVWLACWLSTAGSVARRRCRCQAAGKSARKRAPVGARATRLAPVGARAGWGGGTAETGTSAAELAPSGSVYGIVADGKGESDKKRGESLSAFPPVVRVVAGAYSKSTASLAWAVCAAPTADFPPSIPAIHAL